MYYRRPVMFPSSGFHGRNSFFFTHLLNPRPNCRAPSLFPFATAQQLPPTHHHHHTPTIGMSQGCHAPLPPCRHCWLYRSFPHGTRHVGTLLCNDISAFATFGMTIHHTVPTPSLLFTHEYVIGLSDPTGICPTPRSDQVTTRPDGAPAPIGGMYASLISVTVAPHVKPRRANGSDSLRAIAIGEIGTLSAMVMVVVVVVV